MGEVALCGVVQKLLGESMGNKRQVIDLRRLGDGVRRSRRS